MRTADLPPRWTAAELAGDAVTAARALLGSYIWRRTAAGLVILRITETEAYGGIHDGHPDDASHAHRGKTARNAPMFAAAGTLYVYLVYGLHHCANIVTGPPGTPAAVLLRGAVVVHGEEIVAARRKTSPRHYADGPGKLAAALALTRNDSGRSALHGNFCLRHGKLLPGETVQVTPRHGIDYAEFGREFPWRFRLSAR